MKLVLVTNQDTIEALNHLYRMRGGIKTAVECQTAVWYENVKEEEGRDSAARFHLMRSNKAGKLLFPAVFATDL